MERKSLSKLGAYVSYKITNASGNVTNILYFMEKTCQSFRKQKTLLLFTSAFCVGQTIVTKIVKGRCTF